MSQESLASAMTGTDVRLGGEFRVNSYTTGNQGHYGSPSVVAAGNGNFVVVWAGQGQGDSGGIFGQRYDSAGNALGGEFLVNSYTTGGQGDVSAAAAADGAFVVVWAGGGDSGDAVFGQRFDSEGVPQGDEFRVSSITTDEFQRRPSAAAAANGNFVVVWMSYRHSSYWGVLGQRFDSDGVALGAEFSLGFVETTASVASDANGNFVVVWDGLNDAYESGIHGQRYDSEGVPQGSIFVVNSYEDAYQYRPSVASDASGNFVVAWDDDRSGYSWDVFGRRFDSAGVAQGLDFQINSYTPFVQDRPSVGATGTNQFVVVWESLGQDGPGLFNAGVFGQRFHFGDMITVKSPNTKVRWRIGSQHRIQWTHNVGAGETFRIELDRNNDGTYEELIAAAAPALLGAASPGPSLARPRPRPACASRGPMTFQSLTPAT